MKRLLILASLSLAIGSQALAASPLKSPKTFKTPNGYQKAYVGVYITDKIGSSFYPVIMNTKEQPYLAIRNTLNHWLQIPVTDNSNKIIGTIQATRQKFSFNKLREILTKPDGSTVRLPAKAIIFTNNQYWLRYDYWKKWLPITAQWNLQTYELYLQPHFELFSQLQTDHERELLEEKNERAEAKRLKKLHAIQPTDEFNAQARASLGWTKPFAKTQSLSARYSGNIDVFDGTFNASGQSTLTRDGTRSAPGYWNYSLLDKAHFHRIQFGDFSNQQTLLVPALNLNDGIDLTKLKDQGLANGFTYQGHTLPETEINVWHNGILVAIIHSDSGGNFTFNDPNGTPGDRYTFRLFFKDGTQKNLVIQLAPTNRNLLQPAGAYNVILQNGYLANNQFNPNTTLASGRVTHAALWYGLTNKLSLGLDTYHLPTPEDSDLGGIDAVWQVRPDLSSVLESLHYDQHTDYAWQSTYTGFQDQTLEFELKQQPLNSPINDLALPLPYTPLSLLPTVLPSAAHFWSIKDNYTATSWNAVTQYRHTDVGDNADVQFNKSLFERLSLGATLGLVRPNYQYMNTYKRLVAFYSLSDNDTLSASHLFVPNQNSTSIEYSHFSVGETGLDYGADYIRQEGQPWDMAANIDWRFSRNASVSFTAQRHSAYLTLSVFGILAEQPGPIDYNNFATGTVSGYLEAPINNSKKHTPIPNAAISIGGEVTKTDKNGHYFLSGLPTSDRLIFKVDPNSLEANLIPDQTAQVVYLRPGTDIELNPEIDMTAGLDGQVEHDGPIPKNAKVLIMDKPGGHIIQAANIEPNGFFVVDKLKEQKYYIVFKGLKEPPKPKPIDLKVKNNWLANVDIPWDPKAKVGQLINKKTQPAHATFG